LAVRITAVFGTPDMRMTDLRLIPVEQSFWPEFEGLLRDSLADGRRTLLRLAEEWRPGVNRFARPGETLIAAWPDDRLVACGGRTVDPDLGAPDIGRLRRLYVHRQLRRCGIGRALLGRVLADAGEHFRILTVHAPDASAARFYERFGFERSPGLPVTHVVALAGRP
jgi:GNAT superfamily N-acetyltransferase